MDSYQLERAERELIQALSWSGQGRETRLADWTEYWGWRLLEHARKSNKSLDNP